MASRPQVPKCGAHRATPPLLRVASGPQLFTEELKFCQSPCGPLSSLTLSGHHVSDAESKPRSWGGVGRATRRNGREVDFLQFKLRLNLSFHI